MTETQEFTCKGCGLTKKVKVRKGVISVRELIGWVFPPSLCPDCKDKRAVEPKEGA